MKKDLNHTRKIYNLHGHVYHKKRLNPETSFWNRCIEIPGMASILKKNVKGKKVLDLGCGSGFLSKQLHNWGAEVTGLDFSKTMIEIAANNNPEIKFVLSNAKSTPFEDKSFELITSSLMAHYFKDLNILFKEVSRLLVSGGSFVFSFHHPFNEILMRKDKKEIHKFKLENYFEQFEYKWKMLEGMEMISYHHTFESIVKDLGKNGLYIKSLLEPKPAPKTKSIDEESYNFTTRIPSFCLIYAVKLRK